MLDFYVFRMMMGTCIELRDESKNGPGDTDDTYICI